MPVWFVDGAAVVLSVSMNRYYDTKEVQKIQCRRYNAEDTMQEDTMQEVLWHEGAAEDSMQKFTMQENGMQEDIMQEDTMQKI